MSSQKNSEASPEAEAGIPSERRVLGERAAGLSGYQDLEVVSPLSLPEKGRQGYSDADRGDSGDPRSVWISSGSSSASARGLARQP